MIDHEPIAQDSGLNKLYGYEIEARDGSIGRIQDFYFDDDQWTIRYFVVDTGPWLSGRSVLISPVSVDHLEWDQNKVHLKLTKGQVEASPSINLHMPISRQDETALSRFYGFPHYWSGPYLWGPAAVPDALTTQEIAGGASLEGAVTKEAEESRLCSIRELTGYGIEAIDGAIGHVEDFIVDDQNWMVRYIVVDTRNWLPGKKVLVAPAWISEVSWSRSKVYMNLSRKVIEDSPEWNPGQPPSRDYEQRLYDSYQQPPYWSWEYD